MTTCVNKLLERLDDVRQTTDDRWLAKCPAHDDRSPSLSVRDLGDTFLVKCWAGCGGVDVMEAVGLCAADFFERPPVATRNGSRNGRRKPYITVGELADVLDMESWVVLACAQKTMDGSLSNGDVVRLYEARGRISRVLETVRHG